MNIEQVKAVIAKVAEDLQKESVTEFSSHRFIEKYAWLHEEEYVEMLYGHKSQQPFRTVHAAIARFLADNASELGIRKTGRQESLNIFGHETEVQWWKKIG